MEERDRSEKKTANRNQLSKKTYFDKAELSIEDPHIFIDLSRVSLVCAFLASLAQSQLRQNLFALVDSWIDLAKRHSRQQQESLSPFIIQTLCLS